MTTGNCPILLWLLLLVLVCVYVRTALTIRNYFCTQGLYVLQPSVNTEASQPMFIHAEQSEKEEKGIIWRALGTKPGRRNKSLLRTTGPCLSRPKGQKRWAANVLWRESRLALACDSDGVFVVTGCRSVSLPEPSASSTLRAKMSFFFCSQSYHLSKVVK